MGEMADFFLEDVEAAEELRIEHRSGKISDEEAYELGVTDENGNTV